ncbi:glycosyltransferase [Williamsia sp. 1135]|uniref:glycosyltransferase n=1 Tax=Williamsia sp. 1135 TaxID=1889262 RepID=UPI000A115210|nr:glycosyltransferase [Williamsia sp. 1135]ORM32470.1 hypothetical protein BFL43_15480 [Williamsia sp. 1135]
MIGYYIHHQGSGHRMRAEAITERLRVPVVALSSADITSAVFADRVRLTRDDLSDTPSDVDANGALHWAPRLDVGLRTRMVEIAEFVSVHRPDAMVVDVSVEVAAFVRLLGVPVVVTAMPGERTDPPHLLAYQLADAIIAPWPEELYRPEWLIPHLHKTTFTGGISRFDGRPVHNDAGCQSDVLVLTGTGGATTSQAAVSQFADDHPELTVRGLGPAFGTWSDDPWRELCSARLVVTNAGQGSVADVAVAQKPAVLLPQDRPFDEQLRTGRNVARAGLAHVCSAWPTADEWATILRAVPDSATSWSRWRTAGAAGRAAAAIEAVLG